VFDRLPPSPYDTAPPDLPEAYYVTQWKVQCYGHHFGYKPQLIKELGPFDTESEADNAASDWENAYVPEDDDEWYSTETEATEVEVDLPEVDWDSAPGGHDDY
jgi:hypothetical protein